MVGILHLSDLHITSENDEIMYMYDDIYNSIKEELSKITNSARSYNVKMSQIV